MNLLNSKILKKLSLGLIGVACYSALAVSNCSACDSSDVLVNEAKPINIELTEAEKQLLQEKSKPALEGVSEEATIENNNVAEVIAKDVCFTDEADAETYEVAEVELEIEYVEEVSND